MTEEGWLACREPDPMLAALGRSCSERKIRHVCAAYCRRFPASVVGSLGEICATEGERLADGYRDDFDIRRAVAAIGQAYRAHEGSGLWHYLGHMMFHTLDASHPWGILLAVSATHAASQSARQGEPAEASILNGLAGDQTQLIREVFGNPFRSVAFDPAWRTWDAKALATGIYEEKAFDRMPILADALQDAGCDNDDILTHLRDPQATHVRGCWGLDVILGKE